MKSNKIKDNTGLRPGSNIFYLILGFGLLFFGVSCYEQVDGCLDIQATNFNANADNACEDDCCTYPKLTFTINHLMGDTTLSYDSLFYDNDSPDSIRIVQISYYLSEVNLSGPDGILGIAGTVAAKTLAGESLTLTNDFVLIDYNKGRSYSPGAYRVSGNYDTLSFRLGLPDLVNTVNPTSLPTGNSLRIQTDSLWNESVGYALAHIRLVSQANNSDTLDYFVPNLANSLKMSLPAAINIDFGQNTTIVLDVDYLQWFKGIDFVAIGNDKDQVIDKIVSNLPNSISIAD